MSKIKPKKGWSVYSKPWAPTKPHEPKKTYINHDRQEIGSVGLSEVDDNSYCELQIPLPEGVNPDNVVFVLMCTGENEHNLRFYNKSPREVENPHYEREMKYYKKALEKYEADKATHKEDLKVWKKWVAQEQEAQLQSNLKHAEDLLKKHGRLIKDES